MLSSPPSVEDRMERNDVGLRLRDYATSELARAIACLAWRGPRVHAGVHQARKSMRRVRATLALASARLGPGARLVDRALREVIRGLSKLRDAHALAGTLEPLLARHAQDAEATALLHRAQRAAARARVACARKVLAIDPGLENRRAMLRTLLAALQGLPWDRIDASDTDAALLHGRARADAARAAVAGSNDADDWHRWRRRVRRLSQQRRALGDASAGMDTHDKRLAELLGQAQDCTLLGAHCGRRSPFAPADRGRLRHWANQDLARLRTRIAEHMARMAAPPDEA
jgi:CHAD domain-containing protein